MTPQPQPVLVWLPGALAGPRRPGHAAGYSMGEDVAELVEVLRAGRLDPGQGCAVGRARSGRSVRFCVRDRWCGVFPDVRDIFVFLLSHQGRSSCQSRAAISGDLKVRQH